MQCLVSPEHERFPLTVEGGYTQLPANCRRNLIATRELTPALKGHFER